MELSILKSYYLLTAQKKNYNHGFIVECYLRDIWFNLTAMFLAAQM